MKRPKPAPKPIGVRIRSILGMAQTKRLRRPYRRQEIRWLTFWWSFLALLVLLALFVFLGNP